MMGAGKEWDVSWRACEGPGSRLALALLVQVGTICDEKSKIM